MRAVALVESLSQRCKATEQEHVVERSSTWERFLGAAESQWSVPPLEDGEPVSLEEIPALGPKAFLSPSITGGSFQVRAHLAS